jgi:phage terminase small subunit
MSPKSKERIAMTGPVRRRNRRLSEKEKAFIAEYLVDLNGSQAAIRAGYSRKSVAKMAYLILKRPRVIDAIAETQAKRLAAIDMRAENVLSELSAVARGNVLDYMRLGRDGEPIVDFSGLERERAAALSEVCVEDFADGRGQNKRDVRRVKFRMHDKVAALDKLAKHFGLLRERVSHENPDGSALAPAHSPRQVARAVLMLLREGALSQESKSNSDGQ